MYLISWDYDFLDIRIRLRNRFLTMYDLTGRDHISRYVTKTFGYNINDVNESTFS